MNYVFDCYLIFTFLGIGIGLFFMLYLLLSPKLHTWANLILGLIIVTIGLELWNDLLLHSKLIYQFPWWFKLGGKLKLLLFTLVFLYVLLLSSSEPLRWWVYGLLAIPVLIDAVVWLPDFVAFTTVEKLQMIDQFYADTRPGPTNKWLIPRLLVGGILLPLGYLLIALYRLIQYQGQQKRKPSPSFRILVTALVGMILYVLLEYVINSSIYRSTGLSFVEWPNDILFLTILLFLIAFFMVKQIEIGKGNVLLGEAEKYRKSTPGIQHDVILEQLQALFQEEKLYLDQDLTQVKLASITGINSTYLSKAINEGLGISFSDYVNQYRVEEAQKRLLSPEADTYTIEAIAQQSGFRSKTAFYRAFRKVTGLSPSAYKKRNAPH